MSRHLSPRELVEAVDRVLDPRRRQHLHDCAQCQERLGSIETALESIKASDDVPEPSPLFWAGFRARVRAATDAERLPRRAWSPWSWEALVVGVPALVVVVLLLGYDTARRATVAELPVPARPQVDLEPAGALPTVPIEPPVWDEMSALAAEVPADTWQLIEPPAGEVAGALIEALTAEERSELARLLREAIGGGV